MNLYRQRNVIAFTDPQSVNSLAQTADASELIGESQLKFLCGQRGGATHTESSILRRDSIKAAGKLWNVTGRIGLSERLIEWN